MINQLRGKKGGHVISSLARRKGPAACSSAAGIEKENVLARLDF